MREIDLADRRRGLAILELERSFGELERVASKRNRAGGDHDHLLVVFAKRSDVVGKRGEPGASQHARRCIDQEGGADLDDDALCLGPFLSHGRHLCDGAPAGASCIFAARTDLISAASARSTCGTPSPVAAEAMSGSVPAAFFKARAFFLSSSFGTASDFDSATISGLSSRPAP